MLLQGQRTRTFTVQTRLNLGFGVIVSLSLLLCVGLYYGAYEVNRDAAKLAFQITVETSPTSRLNQSVESLANKIALFTRTHDDGDFKAGLAQHSATSALLLKEKDAAGKQPQATAIIGTLKTAESGLSQIKQLYEQVAAQFLMTDRSTRGLASQASLLLTLCTQLLNNDGVAIAGPLVPAYRPTLIKALNQVGDIQNATLFAHASADPTQLERAKTSQNEMTAGLLSLSAETTASDLHDYLAEVAQNTRDLGDELANLQKGLTERRLVVEQLLAEVEGLRSRLAPVLEQGMQTAATTADSTSHRTQRMLLTIILGAIAIAVVCFVASAFISTRITKLLRATTTALNQGAEQVAAAANQVSASSQSLAEGSSQQAARVEETSSSLEEMASMAKRNSESVQQAKYLSSQTRAAADSSATEMKEMKRAMDAIKSSSDDIAKIIKTIDEIAFQTNILALNAAVEAARAGEAGAGFAVVADEVRNLAQRAAQSAKETAGKIEEAITKSENGVHISDKIAESLAAIAEKTRKVDMIITEIATASNEQNQGIHQVNLAIGQMDTLTQANASNAEETASAAEELNAQSISLKEAVAELGKLAGIDANSSVRGNVGSSSPLARKTSSSLPGGRVNPAHTPVRC
jgi:methyl-accepting chemotaxis protein